MNSEYMRVKFIIAAMFVLVLWANNTSFAQTNTKKEQNNKKLFSFGLIADPQYADRDTRVNRFYRNSLIKLESSVKQLNDTDIAFTVCLGDMIDGDYLSYDSTLAIVDKLNKPIHKVIGNHDFNVNDEFKSKVRGRLQNKKGYYQFIVNDFTFIVLDGTDLSVLANQKGTKLNKLAQTKIEELKAAGQNNAYHWNGGLSERQIKWFEKQLIKAGKRNQKVIVFCHWPLLPENDHQLWDNRLMLGKIEGCPNVVAWISGHFHKGYYKEVNSIHHLTIKGMVESETNVTYGVIDVYEDRLILKGHGEQKSITLKY